jgi:hypothetical protein
MKPKHVVEEEEEKKIVAYRWTYLILNDRLIYPAVLIKMCLNETCS